MTAPAREDRLAEAAEEALRSVAARRDVKGWVGALLPIVGAIVAVAISWATLGGRLSAAEEKIGAHDHAINGTDGEGGIRQKLDHLATLIEERLPAMR